MSIVVNQGGVMTTIQDLGRYSYQRYGVVVGGAMDSFSHKLANLIVGNNLNEATLEITLVGPELYIIEDTLFSICGASFQAKINDVRVPMGRPIFVKRGTTLKIGRCLNGCRAYIAFQGGIDTPFVLNSRSTYERGKFGGLCGERLKKGDIIPLKEQVQKKNFLNVHHDFYSTTRWFVNPYRTSKEIRVTEGRQRCLFTEEAIQSFFTTKYQITVNSDRMGYRLKGEALQLKQKVELISEATVFGTVQVPPDGQPIVLMADRQTTGGYPKIANVISVDLPMLAQLKPGDEVHFKEVSLKEAQKLYVEQELDLKKLAFILKDKERSDEKDRFKL
ncbi:MAG: biotin-dependent carboxyltransferase family protein [Anaerobacillus sp.]|uniref:5-oxoprolinase subunit C family protein n=1 Tax=Anaerobacillus sp. TaxID=1872506 RepID=UPI00391B1085